VCQLPSLNIYEPLLMQTACYGSSANRRRKLCVSSISISSWHDRDIALKARSNYHVVPCRSTSKYHGVSQWGATEARTTSNRCPMEWLLTPLAEWCLFSEAKQWRVEEVKWWNPYRCVQRPTESNFECCERLSGANSMKVHHQMAVAPSGRLNLLSFRVDKWGVGCN